MGTDLNKKSLTFKIRVIYDGHRFESIKNKTRKEEVI